MIYKGKSVVLQFTENTDPSHLKAWRETSCIRLLSLRDLVGC